MAPLQALTIMAVEDAVAALEVDMVTVAVAAGMFPAASTGHPPTMIPAASLARRNPMREFVWLMGRRSSHAGRADDTTERGATTVAPMNSPWRGNMLPAHSSSARLALPCNALESVATLLVETLVEVAAI